MNLISVVLLLPRRVLDRERKNTNGRRSQTNKEIVMVYFFRQQIPREISDTVDEHTGLAVVFTHPSAVRFFFLMMIQPSSFYSAFSLFVRFFWSGGLSYQHLFCSS
jgi:hypothetical protein